MDFGPIERFTKLLPMILGENRGQFFHKMRYKPKRAFFCPFWHVFLGTFFTKCSIGPK